MNIIEDRIHPIHFCSRARAHIRECLAIVVIWAAAFSCPAFGASMSQERAIADLQGANMARKYAAIEALGQIRNRNVAKALCKALAYEQDAHIRLAILDSLAAQSALEDVRSIQIALDDPLSAIRQRAALTITALGRPETEGLLLSRLAKEEDPSVKSAILRGLETLGTSKSMPAVQKAATDHDPFVKNQANISLRRINERRMNRRQGQQ